MPLSNSVLHRYTPPTCTLQVVAYSSPVSRWVGSKVVNQVQFDLRFDDPRSPAEKQFSITGDRNQLEDLHTVVTNYIQELLSLSPESFADLGKETPPTSVPSSPPVDVDVEGDVWLMPTSELPPVTPVSQVPAPVTTNFAQGEFFALKPATKLSHNLFLGSLATRETGQFIQLSVLQLFDLATALDDYETELVALPTYRNNVQTSSAPLAWANIAAVLLLGVGVAGVGLQVFNRPNSLQTANNINNRPKSNNSPQVALAPLPFPTLSPAETLVPPPNSNVIPSNGATTTISVPNKASVGQIVTSGRTHQARSKAVSNGLPPQPIVINPNPGQSKSSTSTTITVPEASKRKAPPITLIPNSNLEASTSSTIIKNVPVAQPDSNSPSREDEPTKPNRLPNTPTRTAFVTNPQVIEVSDYFNQRWEPPSSLRSALEYSIILDVDGSIQVIEPYGIASRTYLDRTGMPLIGERFVSANQNGQSPRIRLRFNPNGKVQAFLESGDAR